MGWGKQDRELWGGLTAVVSKKVNRMEGAPPHLLMVPYPAQPHVLPMLSLAKQIAQHEGITITLVSFKTLIDRLLKTEGDSSHGIHFVGVPDDLPGYDPPRELPHNLIVLRESLQLGHCMGPYVDKLLQDQASLQGPTCMIVDWINWWTIDVAAKLGILRYALCVNPAVFALQHAFCPAEGYVFGEDGFTEIPGIPPFQNRHISKICSGDYPLVKLFSRWRRSILESDGVLLNTSLSLESEIIDALRPTLPDDMQVLPIGPLGLAPGLLQPSVSMEGLELLDDDLVKNWLSEQPPLSVVYASFGTTGLFNFKKRHVKALARGLEQSGQRFLWVFRAPPNVDEDDPELLPPGFEERVRGRGLLLRGWAPQLKILAHPSTGAFLSSCGWNSSLESLALGVPIIGWPSFADQPIICRHLEMTLKVAKTLPFGEDFFVKPADFAKAINAMLESDEGTTMRERMRNYKNKLGADLAPGGSSYETVQELVGLVRHGFVST